MTSIDYIVMQDMIKLRIMELKKEIRDCLVSFEDEKGNIKVYVEKDEKLLELLKEVL